MPPQRHYRPLFREVQLLLDSGGKTVPTVADQTMDEVKFSKPKG